MRQYDPTQPRVKAGSSEGGRWTSDGSGAASAARNAAGLAKTSRAIEMGGLIKALKEQGGFSESLSGKNPETGYMCSISPDQTRFPMSEITADNLEDFVFSNWETLLQDNYYFGGWVDTDEEDGIEYGYLDISENVHNLEKVMKLALDRKQLGVWGIDINDTIVTKDYWDKIRKGRK